MKIVNVAHGSYYMLGGYIGLSVMWSTGSFFLSMLAATLAMAGIGLLMERIFLRRYYLQDMPQVLLTMGFALIFRDIAFIIWGGDPFSFPVPKVLEGSMKIGTIVFPTFRSISVFRPKPTAGEASSCPTTLTFASSRLLVGTMNFSRSGP